MLESGHSDREASMTDLKQRQQAMAAAVRLAYRADLVAIRLLIDDPDFDVAMLIADLSYTVAASLQHRGLNIEPWCDRMVMAANLPNGQDSPPIEGW